MASLITKVLSVACRPRIAGCTCIWKIHKAGVVKKAGKGAIQTKKKELQVEENTELLVTRLCGGNIYKEGEDPVLKDNSEYPEWLWTLRLERTPIPLEELSEDDPKYWKKLKKMNIKRNNALRKYRKL